MDRPTTDRSLWPYVVAAIATAAVAFATVEAAVSAKHGPTPGVGTVRVEVRHLGPDTLRGNLD